MSSSTRPPSPSPSTEHPPRVANAADPNGAAAGVPTVPVVAVAPPVSAPVVAVAVAPPVSAPVVAVAVAPPVSAPAAPAAVALPAKGRPPAWNLTCSELLHAKQPAYKKNLNDRRRGDKGAKARNEAINTALIDELGHACGWDINNLYSAVGPDGKRDPGVKREPVNTSKLDYAAQQVHEGRQIAWRRLVRQVRCLLHAHAEYS
jgi:hypothetical protein